MIPYSQFSQAPPVFYGFASYPFAEDPAMLAGYPYGEYDYGEYYPPGLGYPMGLPFIAALAPVIAKAAGAIVPLVSTAISSMGPQPSMPAPQAAVPVTAPAPIPMPPALPPPQQIQPAPMLRRIRRRRIVRFRRRPPNGTVLRRAAPTPAPRPAPPAPTPPTAPPTPGPEPIPATDESGGMSGWGFAEFACPHCGAIHRRNFS